MAIVDVAERRFSWLAQQRGCQLWHEDDLDQVIKVRGARPDFYVRSPVADFLAEVKAFTARGPLRRRASRVFTMGIDELLTPIRRMLDEASPQLRPYADLPLARVVVLDNWRNVGVALEHELLIQLFGELQFVVPVRANGATPRESPQLEHGRRRALSADRRTHISAVLLTESPADDPRDSFVEERPMRARVLHNPFATVPLARNVFDKPQDVRLIYESGRWLITSGDGNDLD